MSQNNQGRITQYFGGSSSLPNSPQVSRKRERSLERTDSQKKPKEMDYSELLKAFGDLIDERGLAKKQDLEGLASKKDLNEIRQDLLGMNKEIQDLKEDVQCISSDLTNMKLEQKSLTERLDELDMRERKNKLIIKGVGSGGLAPTAEDLTRFFRDSLGVEVPTGAVSICFSAGELAGKKSLAIVKFLRGEDKWSVLKQTKKLHGTPGISIDQDYPEKIRSIRSKLFKLRKFLKAANGGRTVVKVGVEKLMWLDYAFGWIEESGLSCDKPAGIVALEELAGKKLDAINRMLRENTPWMPQQNMRSK